MSESNESISRRRKILASLGTVILMGSALFLFPQLTTQLQFFFFSGLCILFTTVLLAKLKISTSLSRINFRWLRRSEPAEILVVDDNPANRRMAQEMINRLDIKCKQADSGKQAMELHKKFNFKLILMDIEMHNINGIEATKTIRTHEQYKRVPIIAVSAHNDKNKKIQALSSGFDDYLTKPIDENLLKAMLDRWLHLDSKQQYYQRHSKISAPVTKINQEITKSMKNHSTQPEIEYQEENLFAQNHSKTKGKEKNKENKNKRIIDIKKSLIYSHNNPQLAKEMLAMLIIMVSKEKKEILSSFENKNWKKLEQLVHKMNGGSCYCGVPELQKQTQLIDNALQKNSIKSVEKEFHKLATAMEDLLAWHKDHDLDIIFEE